jgi:4-hydroxy-tetrahydrodipicolinate synthase
MTDKKIAGVFTALITPMTETGIDVPALEALVEWQIAQGVHGLVPCGTTGESPTLSHEEHKKVVEIVVKVAAGRVHVMAGAGSNSTAETIDLTRHAKNAGADSVLLVAPYYNKPTAEGQFMHYKTVAEAIDIPMVMYNIPARSVIDIQDDTILRLADACPTLVGVKDATGDVARVARLHHRVGDRLTLLSGDDMTALAFNLMGGRGCISVTANITPKRCAQLQNAALQADYVTARSIHESLVDIHDLMFVETSPAPVKYAAYRMGKCRDIIRLPLVPASDMTREYIDTALFEHGLI